MKKSGNPMLSLNKGLLLSLVFSTGVFGLGFVEEVKIMAANNRNRFENDNQDVNCSETLLQEHLKPKKCNVGRIIEKRIDELLRDCIYERKCESYKTAKSFCLNDYIEKTISVIRKFYYKPSSESETKIHLILKMIYNSFPEPNIEKMAIFTAHALFNTSCFKELEEMEGGDYKCRGLLMIKGEENYSKLDKLCFWTKSFVKNPKCLADLKEAPIKATVEFFLNIYIKEVNENVSLYEHSLQVLKPMEYVRATENKLASDDLEKLTKRTHLFNLLEAKYNK